MGTAVPYVTDKTMAATVIIASGIVGANPILLFVYFLLSAIILFSSLIRIRLDTKYQPLPSIPRNKQRVHHRTALGW